MKKTSVLCITIVLGLLFNCTCKSNQKDRPENEVQKAEERISNTIVVTIEEPGVKSEQIPEEMGFDPNIDYGLLIARSIANEDYAQAMLYDDIKNQKNEYLGIEDNLNYDDLLLLSKIVYAEAGSSWLTDEHRLLVASVVINRVHSFEFPNTIYEVIYQEGQYAPVENKGFEELVPSESSVMAAYTILTEGSIAPTDVVYQANFIQGSETYKEIHDNKLGTTYFCYSENRNLYKK